MEYRPACVLGLCLFLYAASVRAEISVTSLQNGILQSKQPVRHVKALWTVVITFPQQPLWEDTVHSEIQEFRHVIQGLPDSFSNKFASKAHWLSLVDTMESHLSKAQDSSRRKRAILDFVGDIVGKQLFGLSTVKDIEKVQEAIQSNERQTMIINHNLNKVISVVNITQAELIENRAVINQLTNTTLAMKAMISAQVKETALVFLYEQIQEQYFLIYSHIEKLLQIRQKYQNAREDLESGRLSELLLPHSEMEKMANSLSRGDSQFITPLAWYYSNVDVKILSWEGEMTYIVRLPLVDRKTLTAISFISYPFPNLERNVSLKLKTVGLTAMDSLTGQTLELDKSTCVGHDPLVCLPVPIPRYPESEKSCSASLVLDHHLNKFCEVDVKQRSGDIFYSHDVNDFILVTWGTILTEQCEHVRTYHLQPGTYRLKWTGEGLTLKYLSTI